MGIFVLFWAGWTPKVKISLRSRLLYRWRPGGWGVNCGCSAMRLSRSWEFLFCFYFPRDKMTVCLYVLFLCAQAALSVLWVVIRRDPNYVFFLPIGHSSFLDPLVLVCTPRFSWKVSLVFIMMESCANLVFLFPFVDIVWLFKFVFLIYVFVFCDQ